MNLQFTNKGGNFVSEFEVTSDFNLHIEGVRLSDMHIYQKTAGGSYAKVTDFPSERSQDRVADFDFASLVYPKFIKVVCTTEPTYAEIATDGEVTEIKSQSKEVEITANGVTEIAPDNGFGYLSGVKVNVNVPTGGGEGGGDAPSGGKETYDNLVYLQVGSDLFFLDVLGPYVVLGRGENANMKIASTFSYVWESCKTTNENFKLTLTHIAVDENLIAKMSQGGIVQEVDFQTSLSRYESIKDSYNALPRITKEEFFNLA